MDLARARVHREAPVAGLRRGNGSVVGGSALSRAIQGEKAAQSIILSSEEAEEISQRYFVPMYVDFGRLKARGGSRNVAASHQRAGGLQGHAATPRLSLQREFPAARRNLLDAAGNAQERERQFFVEDFEIDAPIVDFNFLQAVGRSRRRLGTINSRRVACDRLCGRQPALEIPIALIVSHQDQTRSGQGQRAKLEMTAQQAAPTKAGG